MKMKPIDLSPILKTYPSINIKGELFDSLEPVVLSEDLLEISLHSGRNIDVGWYPEHDPSGSYRVMLYRDHTGNPLRTIRKKNVFDVIQQIKDWIESDFDYPCLLL